MEGEGFTPEEALAEAKQEVPSAPEVQQPDKMSLQEIIAKQREFKERRASALGQAPAPAEGSSQEQGTVQPETGRKDALLAEFRAHHARMREMEQGGVRERMAQNQKLREQEAGIIENLNLNAPRLEQAAQNLTELRQALEGEEKLAPEVQKHLTALEQEVDRIQQHMNQVQEHLARVQGRITDESEGLEYQGLQDRSLALRDTMIQENII